MSALKITPTDKRLMAALAEDGDSTPGDLADLLGYDTSDWIGRKLRRLRDAAVIRVASWVRNTDGMAIPVYSISPGENAKRPKAQGWSVWSKRYRKTLEDRGGLQYVKARNSLALLVNLTGRRA